MFKLVAIAGVVAAPGVVAAAPGGGRGERPARPANQVDNNRHQPSSLDGAPNGDVAVRALGNRISRLASEHGRSTAQIRAELRHDNSIHLANGQLAVIDEAPAASGEASFTADVDYPLSEAFALHSRPGATRVIYLDVDGHTTEGTYWNTDGPIVSAAWDINGDPTTFDDAERALVIAWWQQVADEFAPWDVDVTTEAPPIESLQRSGSGDPAYGVRVVISPTNFYSTGAAGVAYLNSFGWDSDTPAFVFTQQIGGNIARYVADVIAHEVGHTFSLRHDGTSTTGYYVGHGNWAPIMGYPLYKGVAQFSKGEYPDANNTEDDLALIASYAPWVADDHGDTTSPTPIDLGTSTTGIISNSADVDSFSIPAADGTLNITVTPSYANGALDAKLVVTDASGQIVAEANTAGVGSESVSVPADQGPFVATVDGVGSGDLASGYSDYASIGAYRISVGGDVTPPTTTSTTSQPPSTTTSTTSAPTTTTTTLAPTTTTLAPTTTSTTSMTSTSTTSTTTVPATPVSVTDVAVLIEGRNARAVVTIRTADGNVVAGARVRGQWTNGVKGGSSAVTDINGIATTKPKRVRATQPTFTVTGLQLPDGYVWDGTQPNA